MPETIRGDQLRVEPRHNTAIPLAGFVALAAGVYYFGLMSRFQFDVTIDRGFGLVFNDMLLRLLHGDFSIDPDIIGVEAYVRNGNTYAYFGIVPALVRLVLMPFFDLRTQSVAVLTCTVAAAGTVFFYVAGVLTIAVGRLPMVVAIALAMTCALAGTPYDLTARALVYNEPIHWATCLSGAYVYVLTRSLARGQPPKRRALVCLALLSGVCLHTRFSTAFGLYLATALLVLQDMANHPSGLRRPVVEVLRPNLAPLAILTFFTLLAGAVNYARWDNPFEFANLGRQIYMDDHPDRVVRLLEQGPSNLHRLWFGLQYYYFPIWVLPDDSGRSIFADWMSKNLDGAELPPSSLLLTDALWTGLAGFAITVLARRRSTEIDRTTAIAGIALSVPPAMMLVHIYMALRYRAEFQPSIMLLANYGLLALREYPADRIAKLRGAMIWGAACSIVFSQFTLLADGLSPLGPTDKLNLRELYRSSYERTVTAATRTMNWMHRGHP